MLVVHFPNLPVQLSVPLFFVYLPVGPMRALNQLWALGRPQRRRPHHQIRNTTEWHKRRTHPRVQLMRYRLTCDPQRGGVHIPLQAPRHKLHSESYVWQ